VSEPTAQSDGSSRGPVVRGVESVGRAAGRAVDGLAEPVHRIGGLSYLGYDVGGWLLRGLFKPGVKLGRSALAAQMVRVGVRSIPIVCLVQVFIGVILALQMAPTLESYGQVDRVADIIGIAVFRVLGPLITGILLSGFAGASIAAEIGSMVEGEEIKALRAHAINPIQFLVMPRVVATLVMLVGLAIIADVVGAFGGFLTSWLVLGIDPRVYVSNTQQALLMKDFVSGLIMAAAFGVLIGLIACYEGLNVTGGAEGVGRATTQTVVRCIVALIATCCVFTIVFYKYGF